MPTIMQAFSRNLLRLRESKGLTQTELAALAGISRGSIARYESGKKGATVLTISKIAAILDVEETDLVEAKKLSADDYKAFYELAQTVEILKKELDIRKIIPLPIVNSFRNLSEKDREILFKMIEFQIKALKPKSQTKKEVG